MQAKASGVDLSAQVRWFPEKSALKYLNYGVAATEVSAEHCWCVLQPIVFNVGSDSAATEVSAEHYLKAITFTVGSGSLWKALR